MAHGGEANGHTTTRSATDGMKIVSLLRAQAKEAVEMADEEEDDDITDDEDEDEADDDANASGYVLALSWQGTSAFDTWLVFIHKHS